MKQKKERVRCDYLNPKEVVLDIETTGLTRDSHIFLFGLIEFDGDFYFHQYFAASMAEEKKLLQMVLPLLKDKNLITYNGKTFDLPFIVNRATTHGLAADHLLENKHFDLYRFLRTNRKYIPLKGYRLVDVEDYLEIERNETVESAFVANYFKDYLANPMLSTEPLEVHNRYDVVNTEKALILIEDIKRIREISLPQLKQSTASIEEIALHNNKCKILLQTNKTDTPFFYRYRDHSIRFENGRLEISFDVFYGYVDVDTIAACYLQQWNDFIFDETRYEKSDQFLVIEAEKKYAMRNIKQLIFRLLDNSTSFS